MIIRLFVLLPAPPVWGYCILYSNRQQHRQPSISSHLPLEEDDDDEACTIIIGISHLVSQQLFSFGLGGGEDTPFFRNGYIYYDDGVCEFIFIKLLKR